MNSPDKKQADGRGGVAAPAIDNAAAQPAVTASRTDSSVSAPPDYEQALSLFQTTQYVRAVEVLEQLLAADPGDTRARSLLPVSCLRAVNQVEPGDVAHAERLILRALELNRQNPQVQLSHALFLHRHGRGAEAARYLESGPAAEIHFRLGAIAHHKTRDYAASVEHLERALAVEPDHVLAKQLLPGAAYRAGRFDHLALDPVRRALSTTTSFAARLRECATAVGIDAAADDGRLPDRTGWTPDQRFDWGRRVDAQIRFQALSGPAMLADLQRYTRPLPLPSTWQEGDRGAVILLLHAGSINLAISQLVASGMDYRHITNSIDYGVANPERVIDLYSGRPGTLLARMGAALRRGLNVVVAADGPLGQQLKVLRHQGVDYPVAAGPLVLAKQLRARTHLLVGGFEAREMACRLVEGPPVTASLKDLEAFWTDAILAEIERLTAWGPENLIRQPSPPAASRA
jgi:Flp pilus assembly protein TadD